METFNIRVALCGKIKFSASDSRGSPLIERHGEECVLEGL